MQLFAFRNSFAKINTTTYIHYILDKIFVQEEKLAIITDANLVSCRFISLNVERRCTFHLLYLNPVWLCRWTTVSMWKYWMSQYPGPVLITYFTRLIIYINVGINLSISMMTPGQCYCNEWMKMACLYTGKKSKICRCFCTV